MQETLVKDHSDKNKAESKPEEISLTPDMVMDVLIKYVGVGGIMNYTAIEEALKLPIISEEKFRDLFKILRQLEADGKIRKAKEGFELTGIDPEMAEQPWEANLPILEYPDASNSGADCFIVWNPINKKLLMVAETSIAIDSEDIYDLDGMADDIWDNFVVPSGYNTRGYQVINCFINWNDLETKYADVHKQLSDVNGGKYGIDYAELSEDDY